MYQTCIHNYLFYFKVIRYVFYAFLAHVKYVSSMKPSQIRICVSYTDMHTHTHTYTDKCIHIFRLIIETAN